MTAAKKEQKKPLVYSCSGCSSAAQLANVLALSLDQSGQFEMSCIAGVGAGHKHFIKEAQAAEKILCIDGCSLRCAARTLEARGIEATWNFLINESGIEKRKHDLPSEEEVVKANACLNQFLATSSENKVLRKKS